MMSPSILFPLVVVMAIGLCHVTSVQSLASLPDIVTSLLRRRSLENGQWKRLANPVAAKEQERKSVTFEEGEDDDDDEGRRLDRDYLNAEAAVDRRRESRDQVHSPSFRGDLLGLFQKKSGSVGSTGENRVQLKDRDYFEAIGIAPSHQYHHSSKNNYWNDDDK